MNRKVLAVVFIVTLLALCVETTSVHAQADQVTIFPSDDTYVISQNPDSNYGGQTHLEVVTTSLNRSTVLLKFNLSSIPVGAVVDNVTFQLYTTFVSEPWYRIGVTYLTSNSWNESTLTYNGYQSLDGGIYLESIDFSVYIMSSNQWYSWNQTTSINLAKDDASYTEITLVLLTGELFQPNSYIWFASKENSAAYSPRLIVHWRGIVPEFPAVALFSTFVTVTSLIAVFYRRKNKKLSFAQEA